MSLVASVSNVFPSSGSFAGDLVAIAIAFVVFALLYWAVDLIDRV